MGASGLWALKVMWVVGYGVVGLLVIEKECESLGCLVVKILDKWDTERRASFKKQQQLQNSIFPSVTRVWVVHLQLRLRAIMAPFHP